MSVCMEASQSFCSVVNASIYKPKGRRIIVYIYIICLDIVGMRDHSDSAAPWTSSSGAAVAKMITHAPINDRRRMALWLASKTPNSYLRTIESIWSCCLQVSRHVKLLKQSAWRQTHAKKKLQKKCQAQKIVTLGPACSMWFWSWGSNKAREPNS